MPPDGGGSGSCAGFPIRRTLTWLPVASDRVPLEIAILIPVALLQQLEERVTQSRVHPHVLSGMVASDAMPRERLLKQRLLVSATTVEVTGRRVSGGGIDGAHGGSRAKHKEHYRRDSESRTS